MNCGNGRSTKKESVNVVWVLGVYSHDISCVNKSLIGDFCEHCCLAPVHPILSAKGPHAPHLFIFGSGKRRSLLFSFEQDVNKKCPPQHYDAWISKAHQWETRNGVSCTPFFFFAFVQFSEAHLSRLIRRKLSGDPARLVVGTQSVPGNFWQHNFFFFRHMGDWMFVFFRTQTWEMLPPADSTIFHHSEGKLFSPHCVDEVPQL